MSMDLDNTVVLIESGNQLRRFKAFCNVHDSILLPRAKIEGFPTYFEVKPLGEKMVVVPGLDADTVKEKGLFVLTLGQFQNAISRGEGYEK